MIDSISASDNWRTLDCQNRFGASQKSLYTLGPLVDDWILLRKVCFKSAGAAGCGCGVSTSDKVD